MSELTDYNKTTERQIPEILSEFVVSPIISFTTIAEQFVGDSLPISPLLQKRRLYCRIENVSGAIHLDAELQFFLNNSKVLSVPIFDVSALAPQVYPSWSLVSHLSSFSGGTTANENALLMRLTTTGIQMIPAFNLDVVANSIRVYNRYRQATGASYKLAFACYSEFAFP